MITTIDSLIIRLQELRLIHGDAPVAIEDAESGWHMKIEGVDESESVNGRILIRGAGYSDEDIFPC